MILIYTVTSNNAEAEKLGTLLLEAQLCACVNIVPGMKSMYRWQGKIEVAEECILLIKTTKEKYTAVEEVLKKNHSYETPAIFSVEAEQVEPAFAFWLKNETK